MANARPRDTRAGFDLYRQASTDMSLAELNRQLEECGYRPVSQRTLTHYKNLKRAGFNRYISINRFDVARASRIYENLSSLSRYRYRQTNLAVRVRFMKRSRLLDVMGCTVQAGDVGALVRFTGRDADDVRRFAPTTRSLAVVEYPDTRKTILGTIVDRDLQRDRPIVDIEYTGLHSLSDITGREPNLTERVEFRLISEEGWSNTIDLVVRRLQYFFDLLEGIRSILNTVGQSSSDSYYVEPPVVSRLSIASPITTMIDVSMEMVRVFPWALASTYLIHQVAKARKLWHEGTTVKLNNQLLSKDLQRISEIEQQQQGEITSYIAERLQSLSLEMKLTTAEIDELMARHVLPSLQGLGRNGITNVRMSGSGSDSSVGD